MAWRCFTAESFHAAVCCRFSLSCRVCCCKELPDSGSGMLPNVATVCCPLLPGSCGSDMLPFVAWLLCQRYVAELDFQSFPVAAEGSCLVPGLPQHRTCNSRVCFLCFMVIVRHNEVGFGRKLEERCTMYMATT
jgi:hypothetical protein